MITGSQPKRGDKEIYPKQKTKKKSRKYKKLNETEKSNIPDTGFKQQLQECLINLEEEQVNAVRSSTKRQIKTIKKKNQSELKNTLTEMNNALERINNR